MTDELMSCDHEGYECTECVDANDACICLCEDCSDVAEDVYEEEDEDAQDDEWAEAEADEDGCERMGVDELPTVRQVLRHTIDRWEDMTDDMRADILEEYGSAWQWAQSEAAMYRCEFDENELDEICEEIGQPTMPREEPREQEPVIAWEDVVRDRAAGEFKPYAMASRFAKGDLVRHHKFGDGVVLASIDGLRVRVLFQDEPRLLVQGWTE